jgi:hypothetical protein
MKHPEPKTIGDLIDILDRIREELLTIQRSLERVEDGGTEKNAAPSATDRKDGSGAP